MYQDRIQKNGNVCRCGLGFPEPPSEDDIDGEAETQCGSANERLLFRLGQVNWNEFGKDGAELSGLLEAVRAETSRAVPPSPPPTITERLAVSKKALAERHAIVVQQTAKVANIQKAEESLRSLKDELAALDVKLIGAELAVDLAEAALRGRDPLEGDGDDDGDDVEDLGAIDVEMQGLLGEQARIASRVAACKLQSAARAGWVRVPGKRQRVKQPLDGGAAGAGPLAAAGAAAAAALLGANVGGQVVNALGFLAPGGAGAPPGVGGAVGTGSQG